MQEIENAAKLVKKALENHPDTRNNDNYLYYVICHDLLENIGLNIDRVSLSNALLHRKEYGLPPFETVIRTRQKIQAECPELAGTAEAQAVRNEKEKAYRNYAREGAI